MHTLIKLPITAPSIKISTFNVSAPFENKKQLVVVNPRWNGSYSVEPDSELYVNV